MQSGGSTWVLRLSSFTSSTGLQIRRKRTRTISNIAHITTSEFLIAVNFYGDLHLNVSRC